MKLTHTVYFVIYVTAFDHIREDIEFNLVVHVKIEHKKQ